MLQTRLSYAQIGTFSLAAYPYSLKLLWSPIVDSVYSSRWGRRKTWIIPIQVRNKMKIELVLVCMRLNCDQACMT